MAAARQWRAVGSDKYHYRKFTLQQLPITRKAGPFDVASRSSDNNAPATGPTPAIAAAYDGWLERQPLADQTRRAYRRAVGQYLDFLDREARRPGNPLTEPHARDLAARDFKRHLKHDRNAQPSSVNLALAAVDHFYRFRAMGPPLVARETLPKQAPRALDHAELRRFLRAAERFAPPRDLALVWLMYGAALRVGECVALDTADIAVSSRRGKVLVREGKGDNFREVPLNGQTRSAVDAYLQARRGVLDQLYPDEAALFLNRSGGRLSTRSIDSIVRALGEHAGLELSPHVLRHTCLTKLLRAGTDLVLVADMAGHKRLETTRRYSLPTARDRESAMDAAQIEF
jgi:integrase/recombinase XerC